MNNYMGNNVRFSTLANRKTPSNKLYKLNRKQTEVDVFLSKRGTGKSQHTAPGNPARNY